ncbi:MAG: cyclohydrolase [Campylobacterota bacterium]|nr:cyclohydrolase [Campylobacterota bacterium]
MLTDIEISNQANLPTKYGTFFVKAFKYQEKEHLALYTKELTCKIPLVRIHSECLTGDALGSKKCDCGEQLEYALKAINKSECGVLIYLRQEGRNIGLLNKINAYNLQDQGFDTIEANHQLGFSADERTYEVAEYILEYLGIKEIELLTNNPKKLESFQNIKIAKRVPIIIDANKYNILYLKTKKEKSGHLL